MKEIDLIFARAQVGLANRTLIGFLVMLFILLLLLALPSIFGPAIKASPEIISLVSGAVGSLGTILAQQNGFFFARHRQNGLPEPSDPVDTNPTSPPQAAKSNS
jgi:hypothetical protein